MAGATAAVNSCLATGGDKPRSLFNCMATDRPLAAAYCAAPNQHSWMDGWG